MDIRWPLVGRRDEVELIDEVLTGTVGGLVFAGLPGVGKTRLLQSAMRRAKAGGHAVELVAATRAGASVPLGAASHLLPAHARSDSDRIGLFRRAAERLAGARPAVLAVDDAHLLDDGSAALVHYLCTHGRVVVMATVRGGEPVPDAITALWKDGLVRRVEVPPLSDSDVDELLEHALHGHVSASVRVVLRRLAAGNPLHLRALVLDGIESGVLRRVDETWHWHGALTGAWRLQDLVEARLHGCDAAGRSVVELVACGEPLPLGLVEPDAALIAAERAGLLDVGQDGRRSVVRLAHPIYGEVLRAHLRPIRAREIYRTLAARLGATPLRRRDDLLRIATWQLAAGAPPDASVLLPAARQAKARYDLPLAERLARAAVDAGVDGGRSFLADVLLWRGRHDDGIALLSAEPPGDDQPSERASWLAARARLLYWGLARHGEARATLSGPKDDTSATHALILLSDGQCRAALDVALRIIDGETESVDSRLWAYTAAVSANAALGRTSAALRLAEVGKVLAEGQRGEIHIGGPYLEMAEGYALLFAGRLARGRALVDRGTQDAVGVGDHGLIAAWAGLGGVLAQLQGDLAASVTSLREAVAIEERQDPTGNLGLHLTVLAGALAMSGAVAEAQRVLLRADGLTTPVRRLFAAQVETNRAWVAACAGELSRAADLAIAGAAVARDSELPCLEALVLHDAARHGAARRVWKRLRELAGEVESELIAAYARSATALAADDGPGLAAVAATFAELDAPLLAAEAMVAASKVFQANGAAKQANFAREQARNYTARCPMANTPGLVSKTGTVPLTPREREIALLAARSVTSPEIARRLRLSVRTVNNHLARVYDKLGVSGRAELAALFAAPPVD